MKTLVTFNNLDETGGHRQSELCSHRRSNTKGFYLYEESTTVKLREAESRMVVTETRGRGEMGNCCVCVCVCVCTLSCVLLFVTPWTAAHQAPLSMEFYRQEHWSGVPFPPPGDLPSPGIEPRSLGSPALAGGFFTTSPPGKTTMGNCYSMGKKCQLCKMKN